MSEHDPDLWGNLAERDGQPRPLQREFGEAPAPSEGASRRDFLRAVGFTLAGAAVTGCGKHVEQALPYLISPEQIVPGESTWYATTCGACPAACGLLAKCRDGRPIKLEGNPAHPLSRGGLCAVGQASLLGLYDSTRLELPRLDGQPVTWPELDTPVIRQLNALRRRRAKVRFLTGACHSPTLTAAIATFLADFDGRHVVYDTVSADAIAVAHERTHQRRVIPRYRFDRARLILGIDCDFLGTWLSPIEHTAARAAGRRLDQAAPESSRHVQIESLLTLTGSKADERRRVAPGAIGLLLSHLVQQVAAHARVALPPTQLAPPPLAAAWLARLAGELWAARGRALVACGSNDLAVQLLVNQLNHLLGAYGSTLTLDDASRQRPGDDAAFAELLAEVERGEVEALLIAGCNPLYDHSAAEILKQVPLLISFSQYLDETAAAAKVVCAVPNELESWADGEPVDGLITISQPLIQPFGATRPVLETLASWQGRQRQARDVIREHWQTTLLPRLQPPAEFEQVWVQALRQGFVQVAPTPAAPTTFDAGEVRLVPAAPEGGLWLSLYTKVGVLEPRWAGNPWLQELPDPISKATWDNYACCAPATAAELGLSDGDQVELTADGTTVTLPVCLVPGQAEQTIGVALGYGGDNTRRFAGIGPRWIQGAPTVNEAGLVGANAAPLVGWLGGRRQYQRAGLTLRRTGERRELALAQTWSRLEVPEHLTPPAGGHRPMVESTTLAAYRADRGAGGHPVHEWEGELWPEDHVFPRHHWAMVIDLEACTGCGGCVVACNVENNIPVVGRDEVQRRREMHWLRIDRYFSGDDDQLTVAHQPMLCHHCDNAPCEVVCPVLATVHSEEGLNQQVYNRCVGTRYCANNCPFKVRRFNWFEYPRDDARENLVLNPDVTVRSRGVMEKCSFCVQRIEAAKIAAKAAGRPMADGEVQPACLQSCPAKAIRFGDLNDPESEVSKLMENPRRYQLLNELNIKPTVSYLRAVRNAPESEGHDG